MPSLNDLLLSFDTFRTVFIDGTLWRSSLSCWTLSAQSHLAVKTRPWVSASVAGILGINLCVSSFVGPSLILLTLTF